MLRSPLAVTAALSVTLLIGVSLTRAIALVRANTDATSFVAAAGVTSKGQPSRGADWQQEMTLLGTAVANDPSATSTTDTIAMIGPMITAQLIGQYAGLHESGTFTTSNAAAAAESIAPNVRAVLTYKTYSATDLTVDADTSYDRMLRYRADLREAFAPLLKNTSPELELYAKYIQTRDPTYLSQLQLAATNYRDAARRTAAVEVPRDAVSYHIAILNAIQEFTANIDALSSHGSDAFTGAALLRSYNQAEQDVFNSFNNLSSYYSLKTPRS